MAWLGRSCLSYKQQAKPEESCISSCWLLLVRVVGPARGMAGGNLAGLWLISPMARLIKWSPSPDHLFSCASITAVEKLSTVKTSSSLSFLFLVASFTSNRFKLSSGSQILAHGGGSCSSLLFSMMVNNGQYAVTSGGFKSTIKWGC
jgi:hypothetical protein